jgi:hypothetical protein
MARFTDDGGGPFLKCNVRSTDEGRLPSPPENVKGGVEASVAF